MTNHTDMIEKDLNLIQDLVNVFAPSGRESAMKEFIIDFVHTHQRDWKVKPEIIEGSEFQDCVMLKFGQPRTAVFAHMDSIGFTVRYENQLVPIGSPDAEDGYELTGSDNLGLIDCKLVTKEDEMGRNHLFYDFGRGIQSGTELVFKSNFRSEGDYIQSCYMDNRLGIFNCLKIAEDLENGILVFSTGEEHGGGSVPFLTKYIYEKLGVKQALISDITWVTEGVKHGEGVAISMRDMSIPRRSYVDKIIELTKESGVSYQIEVERAGGSDGREIQSSPYPVDWCFIGAPEDNVHSPNEKVHKADIAAMVDLYKYLLKNL
ncbi:M20/M25/M40 family metallo-hydrolase [Reichenbachiella versicolor]|uniref:M20/M25/M40 family metallo-hydrolase n=1 Tax=Reichenbachiella versicolor TaxID=1821036 RepID=UPI001FEC06FB|nr:M20/M25/M40 family metallo-hydrolase [Reichenbachiella versicolor]